MAVAVCPTPELFNYPGGLAGGGVGQAVGEGLRAGRLLFGITRVPAVVIGQRLQGGLFGFSQVVHCFWVGRGNRHIEVYAGQMFRVEFAYSGGDHRPPVAALGDVAAVAEAFYEMHPHAGCAVGAVAKHRRAIREAVAGQRRADHMESIGSIAAVRGRVSQRLDDLVELHHRAGPAVGDEQRHSFGMWRRSVDEVDAEAVYFGTILGEAVEVRFLRPPVVFVGPVGADFLEIVQRHAQIPACVLHFVGPAGIAKTGTKIVEHFVGDVNGEWRDIGHVGSFEVGSRLALWVLGFFLHRD